MKSKFKLILIMILTIFFSIICYLIRSDKIIPFDTFIYNIISSFKCNQLTIFFKFITNFANYIVIIILCIILFIFIKNKWYGVVISINIINSTIINKVLKAIFLRPRPLVLRLIKEGGYSFPSGHTMAATSFYGFIIYLIYKSNIRKKYKLLLEILLFILIVLIGISRIYLGVHYASDVLAGYLVSIIYLIIFTTILKKINNKNMS